MSLYDFYMYLKYIELSPENLEFYLWYVASYGRPGSVPVLITVRNNQVPGLSSPLCEAPG
jgi:hypothetical protein